MDSDRLRLTALAHQLTLPSTARFTHLTAAALRGWWLPPLPDDLPLFASMEKREPRPRRTGLIVCRHTNRPTADEVNGVRLDPPSEILLACARDLAPLDMSVLVDAALHTESCSLADLEVAAKQRRRGAPNLRSVLPGADSRAESAWEVLLRKLHESCDIEVEPQHTILDDAGTFVARGDLWLVGTRTVHEYDGADHRTGKQQRKDLKRERRIEDAAWVRRGYTKPDVLNQAVTILRDADQSLGRTHDPARIRVWHAMIRASLFTPSGIERLRRRLSLASESGQSAA